MKRIAALFGFLLFVSGAFAQRSNVNSANGYLDKGKLGKAKEKIEPATEHEKSRDWSKTWFVRGKLYQSIFEYSQRKGVSQLMNYDSLAQKPLPKAYKSYMKTIETGKDETTLPFGWGKPNPYKDDVMKRLRNDDRKQLDLKTDFLQAGINGFNENDYEKALRSFEYSLKIDSFTNREYPDTAIYFNAAAAAFNLEKFDKAAQYYETAADLKHKGPKLYSYAASAYKRAGDTTQAIDVLQKGMETYPDNNITIMNGLINTYLNTGKTEQAHEFLNQAIEKSKGSSKVRYEVVCNPAGFDVTYTNNDGNTEQKTISSDNWETSFTANRGDSVSISAQANSEENAKVTVVIYYQGQIIEQAENSGEQVVAEASGELTGADYVYYHAKGSLFDKSDSLDKAEEFYKKALELNPDYFDSNYNLGYVYYRKGTEAHTKASEIPQDKPEKYKKAMEDVKEIYEKSLEYVEKAYEMKPKDENTVRLLRSIYRKLKMEDKYEEMKKKYEKLQGSEGGQQSGGTQETSSDE